VGACTLGRVYYLHVLNGRNPEVYGEKEERLGRGYLKLGTCYRVTPQQPKK